MEMREVLIAAGVVAGLGLLLGIVLGIAGKLLAAAVNEKEVAVRACLPGVNCGACGYAGCDAYAAAVAAETAPTNLCVVAGEKGAREIAAVMGKAAGKVQKRAAVVRCSGSCKHTGDKYIYDGVKTCAAAAVAPGGGQRACEYACLGFGACAEACPQQCIDIIDGVAVVQQERCIACGKCVAVCPKELITVQAAERPYTVRCSSHDKGKAVKDVCDIGCIGCGLCAKVCPVDAIKMDRDLARIDQELCIACGACAEKCPVHVIY